MHIKELVLENFKSFGRKTRIPFYEDFTTISGPNGSGKSNIIDGVLFALGLARTRGIRAQKLTDLIYNPGHDDGSGDGSAGPSEASVTVVLDNGDRAVERGDVVAAAGTDDVGDVDEITVRRRVKETESNYYSYYYLNGRSVNLSDIRELLATAGVTPEGYNVVMQGDVTDIISMSAVERRKVVDEIAGVAEFDAKKEDAFEELETVRERIEEAELRIEEKEGRLDRLEDERETALEYRDLQDEKEEYEGYRKAAELEDKRGELADAREEAADLEDRLADLQRELDEREGRVVRLEEDLADVNDEIERKGEQEQLEIKSEIEEIKGDIARLEDRIEASEEAIADAETERREAFVEIDRKGEEVEELEAAIRDTKVEAASVKSDRQEKEAELAGIREEIENADTEFDELKSDLQERKDAIEAAKTERNDLQREKDRLLDETRRRAQAIEEVEREVESERESIPELEAEVADVENELEKARENREGIAEVVDDLRDEKRAVQAEIDEIEEELQAKQARYAELEANAGENGDSSFGRAVSTVLNAGLDGVHGAIAQLGSVPEEYATACETAAGGRMANVVVDDDGVGQRCIDFLKSRNAGRATFLPLTEMDDRGVPGVPDHPGVVDFAYNLVTFDDRYAGAFSYVLGSTLVVEDLDTARELMGDYRLVTVEGDLVEKTGAMTGGSGGGSRYSFERGGKGQLERVAGEIQDLEDRRQAAREELREVEDRLDDARDRKTEAAEAVSELEADLERARSELRETREAIDEREERLESLREKRAEIDAEMAEVDERIEAKTEEIAGLESEIEEIEAELAESEIPELSERADEVREEIDGLEDRLDELEAERNELELEKEYAEAAIDDLHDDVEAAQNRKAEHEERIDDLEAGIEDKEAELDEKRKQVLEIEEQLTELKGKRQGIKEDLAEAREARDAQQRKVGDVESDLSERREAVERLEWEIEQLEAEVGDYDPDEVPSHHEVVSEIGRIESEMEALEPVNMLAIDEYDEVQAELEELEDGKATLEAERSEIRERIDSYEAQKRETFMDAYEGINGHFERIFSRLSNGTGTLHLEDDDDPFEGGLTMKAQPEDKPIQRLEAMSGGEKSLTALAFIFAIQRHNPAPFYALDEIDAFLDAANAERVGELVDELAGDAQFVVVTHRSAMLDRSERAIGVTMGEDNVSAVTGIRLDGDPGEVPADD
jgi:chromosome segregation protein